MNGVYMKRSGLRCTQCGSNEFEVTVYYLVPRAIRLECKCGHITPIAFIDKYDNCYGINGSSTRAMYDLSFCEDLEPSECHRAVVEDIREYNHNQLPFD